MCSWLAREGMRERGWGIYMGLSKWSRWSSGYPAPALPVALPEVPIGLGFRSDRSVHGRHLRYEHRNFRLDSPVGTSDESTGSFDGGLTEIPRSWLSGNLLSELPTGLSEVPTGTSGGHTGTSGQGIPETPKTWSSGDLWSELPMA